MIVEIKEEKKEKYKKYKEIVLSFVPPDKGITLFDLNRKVVGEMTFTNECDKKAKEAFIDECIIFFVSEGVLKWGIDFKIYKSMPKHTPFFLYRVDNYLT